MTRRRLLIALAVVVLTPVLILHLEGCSWMESQAASHLQQMLGPGDWHVDMKNRSFWSALSGAVGDVHVEGHGVALHNQPVADLTIDLTGVRTSWNRVVGIADLRFSLHVTEDALNAWLSSRRHELLPHVELEPAAVTVTARDRLLHRRIPGLQLDGVLYKDPAGIFFGPRDARLGRFFGGTHTLELLSGAVNPVLDLRKCPYGLTITDIEVQHGALLISGTAHPVLPLAL
ncbi:MAG: LmeA family phospholipid-binding protein [Candidatus Xenobia bacterium]